MTGRLQLDQIQGSDWVTNKGDDWLKFGSFKVGLDGGMNAGTAYMREPYGPYGAQLFGINDPTNRGNINFTHDALLTIMRAARDKGWQLSAHSQGGGAVDALLNVFEILNKEKPIEPEPLASDPRELPIARNRSRARRRSARSLMFSRSGCTSTACLSAR